MDVWIPFTFWCRLSVTLSGLTGTLGAIVMISVTPVLSHNHMSLCVLWKRHILQGSSSSVNTINCISVPNMENTFRKQSDEAWHECCVDCVSNRNPIINYTVSPIECDSKNAMHYSMKSRNMEASHFSAYKPELLLMWHVKISKGHFGFRDGLISRNDK